MKIFRMKGMSGHVGWRLVRQSIRIANIIIKNFIKNNDLAFLC